MLPYFIILIIFLFSVGILFGLSKKNKPMVIGFAICIIIAAIISPKAFIILLIVAVLTKPFVAFSIVLNIYKFISKFINIKVSVTKPTTNTTTYYHHTQMIERKLLK